MEIAEATGWVQAALVVVNGDIDFEDADELKAFAVRVASATGRPGLVIDMSGVEFMGSAGLSSLLHVKDQMGVGAGWLRLRDPSSAVRRVLELTGSDGELLLPLPQALGAPEERAATDGDGSAD